MNKEINIMQKKGVLLHISSLPSNYGIGALGESAYQFVDFLAENGFDLWQVLPLAPTSYGDSPYQSPSAFAGNPYFIDLDVLITEGLLLKSELENIDFGNSSKVDYGKLYKNRYDILRKAATRFVKNDDFYEFKKQNLWLGDYAIFMCLKDKNQVGRAEWKQNRHKNGDEKCDTSELEFWEFTQYKFFQQWNKLKKYANSRKISIVGDMPIYVANDSVEFWANKEMFLTDEDGEPSFVAGVPPDIFSASGQLWGNPLYNWKYLQSTQFSWWVERIKQSLKMLDYVRIDHFRGFESFWAVPATALTAEKGEWLPALGTELFKKIAQELPSAQIIAEDLGTIDASVRAMLKATGYPGMKVMQFGFDNDSTSEYLPNNYPENCIAYTGTHDNNTSLGYFCELKSAQKKQVLKLLKYDGADVVGEMLRQLFSSKAKFAIAPLQDFMRLNKKARMNTPSTKENNWQWRLTKMPTSYDNKCFIIK